MSNKSEELELEFFYDFISPFSYFAWLNVLELSKKHPVRIKPIPVVFGKLLDHWGQLGPAEIEPKREWVFSYCFRYANLHEINFNAPQHHPFNPVNALRLTLPEVAGDKQTMIISALYQNGWGMGNDLSDVTVLHRAISDLGLDADSLISKTQQPSIKQALRASTDYATNKGVFGVPTILFRGRLFWGNDQFDHIELCIQDKDPLSHDHLLEIKNRTEGSHRKSLVKPTNHKV